LDVTGIVLDHRYSHCHLTPGPSPGGRGGSRYVLIFFTLLLPSQFLPLTSYFLLLTSYFLPFTFSERPFCRRQLIVQ
jgi:hypothetical protein